LFATTFLKKETPRGGKCARMSALVVTAILKNRNLKRFAGKSPLIGHKKKRA